MIPLVALFGFLPGWVAWRLYPALPGRGAAAAASLGFAALLAGVLVLTAEFWWLPADVTEAPAIWRLIVAALIGAVAGLMLGAAYVTLFGGRDPTGQARPLHRVIGGFLSGLVALLLCPALVELQNG